MNYRHAYHAGSHSDVLKHAMLTTAIGLLHDKPAPLFLLDTHAGIGAYDLGGIEASKTGEWQAGIGAVLAADILAIRPYLDIVRSLNPSGELLHYPGSPAIMASLLRPKDRLVLSELHPSDIEMLRRWARGRPGVAVHHRNAYEALKAFLPPKENRGLIVVDPPYEVSDEYDQLAKAVVAGYRRWPGGRWMIWHPIKDRTPIWRLEESLLTGGITNAVSVELLLRPLDGIALAGSGVIFVNPPFGLETWAAEALPELKKALAPLTGSFAYRALGLP